jgi:hypothetical protein
MLFGVTVLLYFIKPICSAIIVRSMQNFNENLLCVATILLKNQTTCVSVGLVTKTPWKFRWLGIQLTEKCDRSKTSSEGPSGLCFGG